MVLRELTVTPTKRSFLPSLPGSRLHWRSSESTPCFSMDFRTLVRHSNWSFEAQSDACLLGLEGWVKDELVSNDLLKPVLFFFRGHRGQGCTSGSGASAHADWQNRYHVEGAPREPLPVLCSSRSTHY